MQKKKLSRNCCCLFFYE